VSSRFTTSVSQGLGADGAIWTGPLQKLWTKTQKVRRMNKEQLYSEKQLLKKAELLQRQQVSRVANSETPFLALMTQTRQATTESNLPPLAPHFRRKFMRTALEAEAIFNQHGLSMGKLTAAARKAQFQDAKARIDDMPRPDPSQPADSNGTFKLPDGNGSVQYMVLGARDPSHKAVNFVICVDALDSIEALAEIINATLKHSTDSQYVLVSLPGQSGTQYRGAQATLGASTPLETTKGETPPLTAEYHAQCLHALLTHLNDTDQFFSTKAAAAAGLDRSVTAEEDKLIAAGKRTHRGKRTDAFGRKVKPKIAGIDTTSLNGALPQKFHLVGMGSSFVVVTRFLLKFGKVYKSLLLAAFSVNGFAELEDDRRRMIEDEIEQFGSVDVVSDTLDELDMPLALYAKHRLSFKYLENVGTSRALSQFFDAPGRKAIQRGAHVALLDGVLAVSSLKHDLQHVPVPLVIAHGDQNRFMPLDRVKESLSFGRIATTLDIVKQEAEADKIAQNLDTLGALHSLTYPPDERPRLLFSLSGLKRLKQTVNSGTPNVALIVPFPDVGYFALQEGCGVLVQLLHAASNPSKHIQAVQSLIDEKERTASSAKLKNLAPAKSEKDAFLDAIRSGTADGISNPLFLKNPTDLAEIGRRKSEFLDGRPLPAEERRRRLAGGARTAKPKPKRQPSGRETIRNHSNADMLPKSKSEITRRKLQAGKFHRSGRLSTFGVTYGGDRVEGTAPVNTYMLDDSMLVAFTQLTAKGESVDAVVQQREHALALERQHHTELTMSLSSKRRDVWEASDAQRVNALQDQAYATQKAVKHSAARRDQLAKLDLQRQLGKLDAELHDPEWSMEELEAGSGVMLFGPNGPARPVLPAFQELAELSTGILEKSHTLSPQTSVLSTTQGAKNTAIETKGGSDDGESDSAHEHANEDTSPPPASIPQTQADMGSLDAGQTSVVSALPGRLAIPPHTLRGLGTSVSLEQLPHDMLPGPGEVSMFSPLGKALDLVKTKGRVAAGEEKNKNAGESAAQRSFLEMATLQSTREYMEKQGPTAGSRALLTQEQFWEVQDDIFGAHADYMEEQAHLEALRLDAAYKAYDYDTPAMRIQTAYRGFRGRKIAFRRRILQAMKFAAEIAGGHLTRVARGFLARCKARRLRRARLRMLLIHHNARIIQRAFRAYVQFCSKNALEWSHAATTIQRVFRGVMGRRRAFSEKARQLRDKHRRVGSIGMQSLWRGYKARKETHELLMWTFAATALQRWYRGHIGRTMVQNQREFLAAEPGSQRLQVGMKIVNYWYSRLERIKSEISFCQRRHTTMLGRLETTNSKIRDIDRESSGLTLQLDSLGRLDDDIRDIIGDRDTLVDFLTDNYTSRAPSRKSVRSAASRLSAEAQKLGVPLSRAMERLASDSNAEKKRLETANAKARLLEEAHTLQLALNLKKAEKNKKFAELKQDEVELQRERRQQVQRAKDIQREMRKLTKSKEKFMRAKVSVAGQVITVITRQGRELKEMQRRELQPMLERAQRQKEAQEQAMVQAIKHGVQQRMDATLGSISHFLDQLMMQAAAVYMPALAGVTAGAAALAGQNILTRRMEAEVLRYSFFDGASVPMDEQSLADLKAEEKRNAKMETLARKSELLDALKATTRMTTFAPNIRMWSAPDVSRWLKVIQMGDYADMALDCELDGDTLADLSLADLTFALAIASKLHAQRIFNAVQGLLKGATVAEASRISVPSSKDHDARREQLKEIAASNGRFPDKEHFLAHVVAGRARRVEEALTCGFGPDTSDSAGNTGLHIAAGNMDLRMVRILLQYGASINAANQLKNTPLHVAADIDPSGEFCEALVGRGADPTALNNDYREALEGAAGNAAHVRGR